MDQPEYVAINGPDGIIVMIPADNFMASPEITQVERAARRRSIDEKDATLAKKLNLLTPSFGSLSGWASESKPYTALLKDCRALADQPDVAKLVHTYLQHQPSVRSAADMLVAAIVMSANADWRQTPAGVRSTAARGWFIGRWLPTFLVINGPITRFLLSAAFKQQTRHAEVFKIARSFLCQYQKFKTVRNAFAHWSFGWEVVDRESWIVIYDERTGTESMRLHRRDGDALHLIAFNIVDTLNTVFFRAEVPNS